MVLEGSLVSGRRDPSRRGAARCGRGCIQACATPRGAARHDCSVALAAVQAPVAGLRQVRGVGLPGQGLRTHTDYST
jgi:hypothetical protein